MIKKLRVAVDHGNRNMKTCQFCIYHWTDRTGQKACQGREVSEISGKVLYP